MDDDFFEIGLAEMAMAGALADEMREEERERLRLELEDQESDCGCEDCCSHNPSNEDPYP